MNLESIGPSLIALAPEIVLSLAICVILLLDMFLPTRDSRAVISRYLVGFLILALAAVGINDQIGASAEQLRGYFSGLFIVDQLACVLKAVFIIGTLICALMAWRSREFVGARYGEFANLLLGAALGACLLVSSNNFVIFFVALETLSLCSYVLAGMLKNSRYSAEASLKYLLYGAVASGIFLFGVSYVYGLSGTLAIDGAMTHLIRALSAPAENLAALLASLLLIFGLGFKIAMVPMHFWCPDVYEGAPLPVTAFLSVVSKAAGFGALLRVFAVAYRSPELQQYFAPESGLNFFTVLFGILAVITMSWGNLAAIKQSEAKRLFAYSSIAHAGYLLLGLTVFNTSALQAMLVYFCVYLLMNLGAFWCLAVLDRRFGSTRLEVFKGAAYSAPLLFGCLFICLVALTGLPPTAGFVAKVALFKVVIGAGLVNLVGGGSFDLASAFYFGLALIGVLNSAVSLYYYMKLSKVMVFDRAQDQESWSVSAIDNGLALVITVPLLLLLNFGPLLRLASEPLRAAFPFLMSLFL